MDSQSMDSQSMANPHRKRDLKRMDKSDKSVLLKNMLQVGREDLSSDNQQESETNSVNLHQEVKAENATNSVRTLRSHSLKQPQLSQSVPL